MLLLILRLLPLLSAAAMAAASPAADRAELSIPTFYVDPKVLQIFGRRFQCMREGSALTELQHLAEEVRRHKLSRTTLIVVGAAVGRRQNRSRLYDKGHGHIFRGRGRDEASPPA